MPTPSKRNETRIQTMIDAHREGKSAREISELLGVCEATARTWLRAYGLEPNGGHGRRAERKRFPVELPERVARLAVAQEMAQDAPTPETGLEVVQARLAAVRAALAKLTGELGVGPDVNLYDKLVKLETFLASTLASLTPPLPPDPEKDPTNLEAATSLRHEIERLIEHAESKARCANCGQSPYRKAS